MLDLIASLQLVPAARFLPARGRHGSLSGQLGLLFHRVDTGQYSAVTFLPLLWVVMKPRPDADIWELVYLATQDHRIAQSQTPKESVSIAWSDSAWQNLVQSNTMAEARPATTEERLKHLQSRMEVAMKLIPDLIESLGTEAATVISSMFSDVHNSIELPSGDSPSSQYSRSKQSMALQTPELLEQILLHLPMLELLHCQRVCRHWKDVIDSSPVLQQALYFRPAPIPESYDIDLGPRGVNVFNPLLEEVFIEWFTASGCRTGSFRESVAYIPMQRDNPEIFCRPEASWRRMLFQQTVSGDRKTWICYKKSTGRHPYECIKVRSDYTMGQVYDLVNQLTPIPRGDDLQWLCIMRPGFNDIPIFGRKAEKLVQRRWIERQLWYENFLGMADNKKVTSHERLLRNFWCERNPRTTRREVEWVQRELYHSTELFRWIMYRKEFTMGRPPT